MRKSPRLKGNGIMDIAADYPLGARKEQESFEKLAGSFSRR
jgi:hypothetical protein